MADQKTASRTMRSGLPAHPNEVLKTFAKGNVESIRNRKGVNDNIDLELETANSLKPSNESALEFKAEIEGNKKVESSVTTVSAKVFKKLSDDDNDQPGLVTVSSDSFTSSDPGGDEPPIQGIQDEGVQLMSFGRLLSQPAVKSVNLKKSVKKMTALELNNHFSDLIDQMENAGVEYSGEDLAKLYTIQRDPRRRPSAERIQPSDGPVQIRQALAARVMRFGGMTVTPLLKETVKEELRQFLFELIELRLVDRSE